MGWLFRDDRPAVLLRLHRRGPAADDGLGPEEAQGVQAHLRQGVHQPQTQGHYPLHHLIIQASERA